MTRCYVDATATAGTLHHTGIQRIVRSVVLFGSLRSTPVAPLVWDGRKGFRPPAPGERRRLIDVFARGWGQRALAARWIDRLRAPPPVGRYELGAGSILLVPEIPSGDRLEALSGLARSLAGGPEIVGVCHDLFSWSRPEWTAPERAAGFEDYLRFLCRIDRVVCPSRETAGEFLRFRREKDLAGPEPEVRPWPVLGEPLPPPPETGLPLVLCVGTLEPRKNHAALLDACRTLWEEGVRFELRLVGRLRAKGEDATVRRVEALRAEGHPVSWIPRADERELEDLYRRALFTVFPSLGEGFGLPVAESLARGRPCVCSGEGAIGETAADGGCLTVKAEDPADLAAGLRDLLTDADLRERLAAEAAGRSWPSWEDWLGGVFPDPEGV